MNVDQHITAAREAILSLVAAQLPKPECHLDVTIKLWVKLIGPRLNCSSQYAQLAKAYLGDPNAAHPRYGQKWPTPAVLLGYLPRAPNAGLDLVAEFQWLANLSRIRAHMRWDPVECRMVEVSAEDQMQARLTRRYGEVLPPELKAALDEVGGLRGLRLRLRLERDVPFVQRAFVEAGRAALDRPMVQLEAQRPALAIEAVGNVIPLRARE